MLLASGAQAPIRNWCAALLLAASAVLSACQPTSRPITFVERADGTPVDGDVLIPNNEFVDDGFIVVANPEGPECANADDVAIRTTLHSDPVLTSADGNPNICNTVPLSIYFTQPVQSVTVSFIGDGEYVLAAVQPDGTPLRSNSQIGSGSDVRAVQVSAGSDRIGAITFGTEGLTTAIVQLRLRRTDGPSRITCGNTADVDDTPPTATLAVSYQDGDNERFEVIERDTTIELARNSEVEIVYSAADDGGVRTLSLGWTSYRGNQVEQPFIQAVPYDVPCNYRLKAQLLEVSGFDARLFEASTTDYAGNSARSSKLTIKREGAGPIAIPPP